jgi:hypothetical protein
MVPAGEDPAKDAGDDDAMTLLEPIYPEDAVGKLRAFCGDCTFHGLVLDEADMDGVSASDASDCEFGFESALALVVTLVVAFELEIEFGEESSAVEDDRAGCASTCLTV